MGNYNRNTPTVRGPETRYAYGFEQPFQSSLRAVQIRTRPGATTVTNVHVCLSRVAGAPGLGIAVVDTQQPALTYSDFFPGSDTGDTTTNLQDQGGAALNFGDLDSPQDDTEYARNSVALGANDKAVARFRGNSAGALAGRRIARVQIQALVMNRRIVGSAISTNGLNLPVQGAVVMGGNTYPGNSRFVPKVDQFQYVTDAADFLLSPSTGIPWTVTEVDNIISAANADTFGMNIWGKADAQGVRMSSMWLRVYHCAENRKGIYYRRGSPRLGWDRYTLGTTSAELANTEYWVEVGPLCASLRDYFTLGEVWPLELPATDATDNASDHRQRSTIISTGPGGTGQEGTNKIATDQTQAAVLLEAAGPTILADSQAYAAVVHDFVGVYLGVALREGQQITTDTTQPAGGYVGVMVSAGWWDKTQRPTRPLVIEVQHGVGAISGSGVVDAIALLQPDDSTPQISDIFVKFAGGPVVLANSTQYHVHVFSASVATWGQNAWRIPRQDSRTDLIGTGSGTTSANVTGATQGGSADSYFTGGAANTRYDLPIALMARPNPPGAVRVDPIAANPTSVLNVSATLSPRLRVTWDATTLGSGFNAWHVWGRRSATPAEAPVLLATIDLNSVPSGVTAAQIEANYREHWLTELGWGVVDSQYADGWDIGVSVVQTTGLLESFIRWASVSNSPQADRTSWVTSDAYPWLSTPLFTERDSKSAPLTGPKVYDQVAGRDHAVVRVPGTVPGRQYDISWKQVGYADEGILRAARAAALSGIQMSLLRVRGDRACGVITEPSTQIGDTDLGASAQFITTGSDPALAGPNMPPGLVLDGATQYLSVPNNNLLNPGAQPFSVFVAGIFGGGGASKYALSKGNITVADGYAIRSTGVANEMEFFVDGASTSAGAKFASAGWFDGFYHVAYGTYDGTNLRLYMDGLLVAVQPLVAGAVTNTVALVAGANNAGASGFMAETLNSFGLYPTIRLSDDQVMTASRYLLGHAGKRMPPPASAFVDLRDDRCYGQSAVAHDLSGNGLDATIVGAPVQRGVPWRIRELERKR